VAAGAVIDGERPGDQPPPAATAAPSPAPRVLDSLTSLRFVAALMVFLVHGVLFLPDLRVSGRIVFAGPTGVGFFFLLSGFVLTWSFRSDGGSRAFYRRRFARIYPTHALVWVAWVSTDLLRGTLINPRAAGSTLLLVQSWVPRHAFFDGMDAPAWSLACEAFFYLLFPLVLAAVLRLSRRGRRALVGAALLTPLVLAIAHVPLFYLYDFPPARLPEFVAGVVVALEVRAGTWPRVPIRGALLIAGAGLAAVDLTRDPRWWVAIPMLPFLVLIGALADGDTAGRRTIFRNRVFIRLGQWSFAVYLVHGLVLTAILELHPHRFAPPESAFALLTALAASIVLSGLVFTCWERPWERRLRPRHRLAASLETAAALPEPVPAAA
jgi:peptidoglycan/LPS O-acetylase OafA/YrhL